MDLNDFITGAESGGMLLKEPSGKLPIVAIICVVALIVSAWIFFLATHDLAKINYRRKVQKNIQNPTVVTNQQSRGSR